MIEVALWKPGGEGLHELCMYCGLGDYGFLSTSVVCYGCKPFFHKVHGLPHDLVEDSLLEAITMEEFVRGINFIVDRERDVRHRISYDEAMTYLVLTLLIKGEGGV